jgi:hypothetical protein
MKHTGFIIRSMTPSDRRILDALKAHYRERTDSGAIGALLKDAPILFERINELSFELDRYARVLGDVDLGAATVKDGEAMLKVAFESVGMLRRDGLPTWTLRGASMPDLSPVVPKKGGKRKPGKQLAID